MTQRAKLQVEHLEDRTALSAANPYGDLLPLTPGYGDYQPIYGTGSMVQVAGWSATPIYSYYGNGIPYMPVAMVMTYTVVNVGNETSQGTNVVLYGTSPYSSLYGTYYGTSELATRQVGPLAPGQAFTETFVIGADPNWSYFGPPMLDMVTYSIYTPPTSTPMDNLFPGGSNELITPLLDLGGSAGSNLAGNLGSSVGDAAQGVVAAASQSLAAVGATLGNEEINALPTLALQQQDIQPADQGLEPTAAQPFQGTTEATAQNPLDGSEARKNQPLRPQLNGEIDTPRLTDADEREEAAVNALFEPQAQRELPSWLKPLLRDLGQNSIETPQDNVNHGRDDVEVEKPDVVSDGQTTPARPANAPVNVSPTPAAPPAVGVPPVQAPSAQDTLVGMFRQAANALLPGSQPQEQSNPQTDKPGEEKLVVERRVNELTQQQAQMAYFILLGTGLSALQRRVKPAKVVEDRENPRRKRLTRI